MVLNNALSGTQKKRKKIMIAGTGRKYKISNKEIHTRIAKMGKERSQRV